MSAISPTNHLFSWGQCTSTRSPIWNGKSHTSSSESVVGAVTDDVVKVADDVAADNAVVVAAVEEDAVVEVVTVVAGDVTVVVAVLAMVADKAVVGALREDAVGVGVADDEVVAAEVTEVVAVMSAVADTSF